MLSSGLSTSPLGGPQAQPRTRPACPCARATHPLVTPHQQTRSVRRRGCRQRPRGPAAVKEERDVEAKPSPTTSAEAAADAAQQERGSAIELDPESEEAKKQAEADRLRAAERFMVVGSGEATCPGCGYEYSPKTGDSEYPISPGTLYQDLPEDWCCPICGAEKGRFKSRVKTVAGFAENQGYGLGVNSLTSGQKGALIYGSLIFFFGLFLAGYFLN